LSLLLAAAMAVAALTVAGAGIPATSAGQSAAAQTRPNIVVIETDDQTAESVRVMTHVKSLIGNRGTTFTNSFVNFSLCCPSRATFMTGQYMHNHGIRDNQVPSGGFGRFNQLHATNNLAVWLQEAGYYTALVGKYLNGYTNQPRVPQGWSEWHVAAPDTQDLYDYRMNDDGAFTDFGKAPADFKEDVFTSRAAGFVNRRAPSDQPFFLWLTYTTPHAAGPEPNPNPPADCNGTAKPAPRHAHSFDSATQPKSANFNEADVSDKPAEIRNLPRFNAAGVANIQRLYRCELEALLSVDEGVQKVVDALLETGELSDTLLVFTSDNGLFHGEHRLSQVKRHIYEESIRVPLMMRGPGIPVGERVSDPVINADLAPTIVDVANATPGLTMDGRSLIPVAQNPGIEQHRELLIEQPSLAAIRTRRYIYAEHSTGERELYDLQKDPFELQSRHAAAAYAPVRAELARELQKLRNCSGASCRLHNPDPQPR
jgi:arylsulfatase A-like enzyme